MNNTVINPKSYGVYFSYNKGSENRVQNNIIVNPGNTGSSRYVFKCLACTAQVDHNYQTLILADAKFRDAVGGDYSLLPGSPAIDVGINLSNFGITTDYAKAARPQGTTYDEGAFEFIFSAPPAIPTGLRIVE
jgi:hypothetical protein